MAKVFIAGSITIKNLDENIRSRISSVVDKYHSVIVGDADGVDLAVQEILRDFGSEDVTVYCSGFQPRNNVGSWSVKPVESGSKEGTRSYFSAKDKVMAKDADFGLMIWDKKSTGTLSNVIEMVRDRKKVAVYLNKDKKFIDILNPQDVMDMVSLMSSGAKELAEKKISLTSKLQSIQTVQTSLF